MVVFYIMDSEYKDLMYHQAISTSETRTKRLIHHHPHIHITADVHIALYIPYPR